MIATSLCAIALPPSVVATVRSQPKSGLGELPFLSALCGMIAAENTCFTGCQRALRAEQVIWKRSRCEMLPS